MLDFLLNLTIWTLVMYAIFEIIRILLYYFILPKEEGEDTYIVITVKDGEEYIEGVLRSLIYKILYGKENNIKQILIIDLNSQDSTINIIKKLELDYTCIKLVEYGKYKDIIKSEGIT